MVFLGARAVAIYLLMLFGLEEARPDLTIRYPPFAHAARITGEVRIRCNVDVNGSVTNVTPLSGHPLLANVAATTAKLWRFTQTDAISEMVLTYSFRLVPPGTEGTDFETLKSHTRIDKSGSVIVAAPQACIDFVPCKPGRP